MIRRICVAYWPCCCGNWRCDDLRGGTRRAGASRGAGERPNETVAAASGTSRGPRGRTGATRTPAHIPPEEVPHLRVVPKEVTEAVQRGWIPREFNGMRYYDVPLNRTSRPE